MNEKIELGVVIPTKNRIVSVKNLLTKLREQSYMHFVTVVIDSSDDNLRLYDLTDTRHNFYHIYSERQSLTHQKNIGIKYLREKYDIDYFMILDDDTEVDNDYVELLLKSIKEEKEYQGLAPGRVITSDTRENPKNLKGLINKMFMLDGKNGGLILRSGINIPLRIQELESINQKIIETDWIYGCSIWRINDYLYDERLEGQSLYEDVLYSFKARQLGKVGIVRDLVLYHHEETISRPDLYEFTLMWLKNRRLIIENDPLYFKLRYFALADFGNLVVNLASLKIKGRNKVRIIKAYLDHYLK